MVVVHNCTTFISVVHLGATLPNGATAAESYNDAHAALTSFQRSSHLVRASEPRLYAYEQTLHGRSQRGLVSLAAVSDYDADFIKRNGRTRAKKEEDHTRSTDHLSANVCPVFLAYPDVEAVDKIVNHAVIEDMLLDVSPGDDGVLHTRSGLVQIFLGDVWTSFTLPQAKEKCSVADALDASLIQLTCWVN